jgi:hypothetical protein
MKFFVLSAGLFAFAAAECHNGCSGNGWCQNYKMTLSAANSDSVAVIEVPTENAATGQTPQGWNTLDPKKDSCTCFKRMDDGKQVYGYTGADCSLLTCPYSKSWDQAPISNNNHNQYVECGGRGNCDRKNGVCACFEGYEGTSCQRTTCHNQCSNHGTCKTAHEYTKLMSETIEWESLSEFHYQKIQYKDAWDAHKIRGCICDPGWRGADCSIQESPSGPDPMNGEGAESGRECSGRGHSDGLGGCTCYDGFFGARCGNQRANSM